MGMSLSKTLGESGGPGSLICYSSWGHKELDMTLKLKNKNIFTGSSD